MTLNCKDYIVRGTDTKNNIIAFLIIDLLSTIMAIIGNSLFMLTLIKSRSLHTPSNVLLGSLCFSDLIVAFIAQPILWSFYAKMLMDGSINNTLLEVSVSAVQFSAGLSFLFAVIVTLDRFVAIFYPYRYHASANCKTHTNISIIAVILWLVFNVIEPYLRFNSIFEAFRFLYVGLSFMIMASSYIKIYSLIRRQTRAMTVTLGEIKAERRETVAVTTGETRGEQTRAAVMTDGETRKVQTRSVAVRIERMKGGQQQAVDVKFEDTIKEEKKDVRMRIKDITGKKKDVKAVKVEETLEKQKEAVRVKTKALTGQQKDAEVAKVEETVGEQTEAEAVRIKEEITAKQKQEMRQRKCEIKTTHTMAIIVVIFLISYLPLIGFSIYNLPRLTKCIDSKKILLGYMWTNLLAFTNSAVNPVVYFLRVTEMRAAARSNVCSSSLP